MLVLQPHPALPLRLEQLRSLGQGKQRLGRDAAARQTVALQTQLRRRLPQLIKAPAPPFIILLSFSTSVFPWLPGWKLYPLIIHTFAQTAHGKRC